MTTTAEQIAGLRAEIKQLRAEMGTLKPDPTHVLGDEGDGAAPLHTRVAQLNSAFESAFARIAPIKAGETIADYVAAHGGVQQPAPPQWPIANLPIDEVHVAVADVVRFADPSSGLICEYFISGNDAGLRENYNWKFPPDAHGTHSVRTLPQIDRGVETDGAWFIAAFKAQTDQNGNEIPNGPWEGPGKSFKIYALGQGNQGPATEFVSICSCIPHRGLEFCVATSDPNVYLPMFRIHGDGSTCPVEIWASGAWHRMGVFNGNFVSV